MDFSQEQILRYSRQLLLNEIGGEGQKKLLESNVLVVGAGGLGSVVLMYLAGCGVGKIGIVENDRIEVSNLPRQILYTTGDMGRNKVEAAKSRLNEMNPDVKIEIFEMRLNEKNARDILCDYKLIIDCTDNFETRFAINRLAVENNKPLISGAVVRFEGNVMFVVPGKTFCYNCIFGDQSGSNSVITCSDAGVLGSIAGLIATIMVTEAVKFILDLPTIQNNLLVYDGLKTELRKIKINRDPDCPVCKKLY